MRISKMVLQLSVLAMAAVVSTSASANVSKESCNLRNGSPMQYDSNPKTTRVSKAETKSESNTKTPAKRQKATRG